MTMAIRLITEPSVYLIGTQAVDDAELSRFLADHGAAGWSTDAPSPGEALAEIGGRLCYHSFAKPRPGGNAAYLAHIREVGHGSVMEHAVYTLILTGISRSCSHEIVRHRVGMSPSQLSQRFVDESDCAFVVPPALVHSIDTEAGTLWQSACEWSANRYRLLVGYMEGKAEIAALDPTARRKAAREAARSVLPNAVETRICLTGNARAWRHFIELRAHPAADAEIRRLALAVHAKLAAASPHLFGDYRADPAGGLTTATPHA
jgi:thymidylate synthase (FAD)